MEYIFGCKIFNRISCQLVIIIIVCERGGSNRTEIRVECFYWLIVFWGLQNLHLNDILGISKRCGVAICRSCSVCWGVFCVDFSGRRSPMRRLWQNFEQVRECRVNQTAVDSLTKVVSLRKSAILLLCQLFPPFSTQNVSYLPIWKRAEIVRWRKCSLFFSSCVYSHLLSLRNEKRASCRHEGLKRKLQLVNLIIFIFPHNFHCQKTVFPTLKKILSSHQVLIYLSNGLQIKHKSRRHRWNIGELFDEDTTISRQFNQKTRNYHQTEKSRRVPNIRMVQSAFNLIVVFNEINTP